MLVIAIIVMGVMGAVFGLLLGFAGKKFYVEVDPRVAQIRGVLPGGNCGACGFPGCDGLAEAIAKGEAPADGCKPGGAAIAAKIAEILGVSVGESNGRSIARVTCGGDRVNCQNRSAYAGVPSCRAALLAGGGFKACEYGCLGLGDCVRACPFGAMRMSAAGLPEVDDEKCVACGKCVTGCPRGIMELVPESKTVFVRCRSKARGPVVRKACKVGCIACMACVKVCPTGAISVQDNLARIDYSKCDACGLCVAKCPAHAINDLRHGAGAAGDAGADRVAGQAAG
ncbi:MAG: RnfABCDGE type electron transport complex subunit B [Firmicutes bacterium]|nr:RnfABCDGE type electron transport complex subunit B [Bacillota bacterium]